MSCSENYLKRSTDRIIGKERTAETNRAPSEERECWCGSSYAYSILTETMNLPFITIYSVLDERENIERRAGLVWFCNDVRYCRQSLNERGSICPVLRCIQLLASAFSVAGDGE